MVKGPSRLGANFGSRMFHLRFLASSQTLSLTLKGVNLDLIQFLMSCYVSLCTASASFRDVSRFLSCSSRARRWVVLMILGMACGSYPSMR